MRRAVTLFAALGLAVPIALGAVWTPGAGAATVCQTTAYVSAFGENLITPIDAPTRTAQANITLAQAAAPVGIAITKDGTTAFVAFAGLAEVAVVDLATGTTTTTIAVG